MVGSALWIGLAAIAACVVGPEDTQEVENIGEAQQPLKNGQGCLYDYQCDSGNCCWYYGGGKKCANCCNDGDCDPGDECQLTCCTPADAWRTGCCSPMLHYNDPWDGCFLTEALCEDACPPWK